jgi:hypothetical protein
MKEFTITLTSDELVLLYVGLGLYHKDCAKAFYESLEGIREDDKSINVEEFNDQHEAIMSLYSKLNEAVKQIPDTKLPNAKIYGG